MEVWITKYALTIGIFTVDAEVEDDKKMCSFRRSPEHYAEYAHGNDFHINYDSAIKDALSRRDKKLKSLEKQIKKISAMTF